MLLGCVRDWVVLAWLSAFSVFIGFVIDFILFNFGLLHSH